MWVSWQQLGNRVTYSVIGPSVGKVEIMRGLSFYFLPSLDFMAGYQVLISSSAAWCFEAHIANSNPANWVEAPNHLDNDPSRSFLKRKTVSWYYHVGPGSSWSFLLIWFSLGRFTSKGTQLTSSIPWGIEAKESEEIGHGDWHSQGEADKWEGAVRLIKKDRAGGRKRMMKKTA